MTNVLNFVYKLSHDHYKQKAIEALYCKMSLIFITWFSPAVINDKWLFINLNISGIKIKEQIQKLVWICSLVRRKKFNKQQQKHTHNHVGLTWKTEIKRQVSKSVEKKLTWTNAESGDVHLKKS